MNQSNNLIPLSLYIHIPWCVKKCPYCDFNSHALNENSLPEETYIDALEQDLITDIAEFGTQHREIQSIFIGGGTPSLFSPTSIEKLLAMVFNHCICAPQMEITLEANPGTVDQKAFSGFRRAGINRLSMGIQSFQDQQLKNLGRIHNGHEAILAVEKAHHAGFDNMNLDIMHGLPNQTTADALLDLETALSLKPTHLSWYQLTLEPNTVFYQRPPVLPIDDQLLDIQKAGESYLASQGFRPYEISAYTDTARHQKIASPTKNQILKGERYTDDRCKHNLNYWMFGDYLAIGAGAHGKITNLNTHQISRYWKMRHPKDYLAIEKPFLAGKKILSSAELPFEFMMNALRLYQEIPIALFETRTHLKLQQMMPQLHEAQNQGLLIFNEKMVKTTELGKRFLNDLLQIFL